MIYAQVEIFMIHSSPLAHPARLNQEINDGGWCCCAHFFGVHDFYALDVVYSLHDEIEDIDIVSIYIITPRSMRTPPHCNSKPSR